MQKPAAIDPISPFRDPGTWLGALDATLASTALVLAADLALVIDADGVILDVAHNGMELAREGCSAWIGRKWIDTVSTDSRPKVAEMLASRPAEGVQPARQVNHFSPRGAELPVRYSVLPIGDTGRRLALGRELRSFAAIQHRLIEAQHTTEREYTRLRDAEMRYRLLFQIASEALLIVDAATRRITEANPAAEHLLATGGKRLVGRSFPHGFAVGDAAGLERLSARARATGRAEAIGARLIDGRSVEVSAALFRQEASAFVLYRIASGAPRGVVAASEAQAVAGIVAAVPEGYVATDASGVIRHANTAFLNLTQLATEEQALGASLDRFLGRPGVDLNVLVSTLRDSATVRQFTTTLRGEFGSIVDVEICAARGVEGDEPICGFLIRNVGNRDGGVRTGTLPHSAEQLTELVGRVPLRDLVRETTDVIERLCIEAALELTGDNRAAAAEMLGLSRQSLYVKLRRYGLGDLDAPEA